MKRVIVIWAGLALFVGIAFLAVNIGDGTVRGQEEPTPTPTLGPFTPVFSYTFDEMVPANRDVMPIDDDCPVGAPCKALWHVEYLEGQPFAAVSWTTLPSTVVNFANAAVIPDGAIVGKLFGSIRRGPWGSCLTEGEIVPWEVISIDATTDESTTTGSQDDLCSFSHWPVQLNDLRDSALADNPGAVLDSRTMGCTASLSINVLMFSKPDGTTFFAAAAGSPTLPPPWETCNPSIINSVALGVSANNPDTPENEGGIPVRTCIAAGTYTITMAFDRNDTPPGDFIFLEDTVTCSPNTPVGSEVPVRLNGGILLVGGINLIFSEVATGGSTFVVTTTTGPPPPTGFKIVGLEELPLYFDINTDASYSGELDVCVRYDDTQVTGPEAGLRLIQRQDDEYVDITDSVDTTSNVVCGTTTHLSIFVVAEPLSAPTATATPPPPTPPPPTPTRATSVGGAVNLPPAAVDAEASASGGDSGWSAGAYAATGLSAAFAALGVGGWYVRRRRLP